MHTILEAHASDAALIAPLFDAYRRFYTQPPALEACREWLHQRLSRGEATVYIAFVPASTRTDAFPLCTADHRGIPAGLTVLYPTFSSVSLTPRITLNDLFVDPAFRRFGLARQLLLRCMLHATQADAQLQLITSNTNTPAQALYAAVGWTRDDQRQRWTWTPPR
jgi:ribosomal protein S18 acetylase RimI-like enzyme